MQEEDYGIDTEEYDNPEITLDDVDLYAIERVAYNEVDILKRRRTDSDRFAAHAMARSILDRCIEDSDRVILPLVHAVEDDRLFIGRSKVCKGCAGADGEEFPAASVTDEFIVGRLLAMSVWDKAVNIVHRGLEEAMEAIASDIASIDTTTFSEGLGALDDARVSGIDMKHEFSSGQCCTPASIKARAEFLNVRDRNGNVVAASEVLSPVDYRDIAEDFMDSFYGIELDYFDYEEIDDRILCRIQNDETRSVMKSHR